MEDQKKTETELEKSFDKDSPLRKLIRMFRTNTVVKHHQQGLGSSKPQGVAKTFFKNSYSYNTSVIPGYTAYERMARYGNYCLAGDTFVATNTPEGAIRIDEIVEKFNKGEEVYVFAYDLEKTKIVLQKVSNAMLTKQDEIYEIHLDNGEIVKATGNHKFMLRDGTYKEAQDLTENIALMPFGRNEYSYNKEERVYNNHKGGFYRAVYQPKVGWKGEHIVVAEYKTGTELNHGCGKEVHHINFIKNDNRPENLIVMEANEHRAYHASINYKRFENPENRRKQSVVAKNRWKEDGDLRLRQDEFVEKRKNHPSYQKGLERLSNFNKTVKPGRFNKGRLDQKGFKNANCLDDITFQTVCNAYYPGIFLKQMAEKLDVDSKVITKRIQWAGYQNWTHFVEEYTNHKVIKIVKTGRTENVYDITVPVYNNFALKSGIFVHNCEMEAFPIIGKALQIFADETTQRDENGKIITVISKNTKVQDELQDLFDNVLHLNGKKIYKIARDLCKYGDDFQLIDITTDGGVVNLIKMPPAEVEREEGYDKKEPTAVRFRWVAKQNTEIPNAFVAHFRLDGNDMFWPYGQCLKYDTRIHTADGIKTIDQIKKEEMVLVFDQETQKYKSTKVLDVVCSGEKECYKISSKHNFIEASKEHKIYVVDKEKNDFIYKFADEIKLGDKLVIKKEHETNKEIKINKEFKFFNKNGYQNTKNCIPDFVDEDFAKFFGFMLGDGWLTKRGSDVVSVCFALGVEDYINQAYIELAKKLTNKTPKLYRPYKKNQKLKSNQEFGQVVFGSKMLAEVLLNMGWIHGAHEKRIPAWVFESKTNIKEAFLQGFYEADGSIFTDKWNCKRYQIELCNEQLIKDLKCLVQSLGYKSGRVSTRTRNDGIVGERTSYYFYYFKSQNKQIKKYDTTNRKTEEYILEPISKIELSGKHKVYDIFVENDNHNFIANGVVVHNSAIEAATRPWRQLILLQDSMMIYRITRSAERRVFFFDVGGIAPEDIELAINKFNETIKKKKLVNDRGQIDLRYGATMDMVEDYVLPVRDKDSATRIETLPGGQNIGDLEDVQMIEATLFAALGIPKAFLTYDEAVGSKQVLTHEDIRFSRTVQKIQEAIINELVKVGIIHLYIKGVRGKDLYDFKIRMTNPSTVSELQKIELWRARLEAVQAAGQGVFDTTFIYKNFLRLSDEAIDMIRKGQIQDKIFQTKLMAIESAGAGGMAGGMGAMGPGGGMGGLGGGMGMGGGMDMGMGAPMGGAPGGAPPAVGGMPPIPMESFNPAANILGGAGTGKKDLSRRNSNERIKTVRGLPEEEIMSAEDVSNSAGDGVDVDGIRRDIESPFGMKEHVEQMLGLHANISPPFESRYTEVGASMDNELVEFLDNLGLESANEKRNLLTEHMRKTEEEQEQDFGLILPEEWEKMAMGNNSGQILKEIKE